MVAYSFQPRFVLPILTGTKLGTIRATGRKRHALPGEKIQHYTGLRTKQASLFATAVCKSNETILINFGRRVILIGDWGAQLSIEESGEGPGSSLDHFARQDGFADFSGMEAFWEKTHGGGVFEGRWICWDPESIEGKL